MPVRLNGLVVQEKTLRGGDRVHPPLHRPVRDRRRHHRGRHGDPGARRCRRSTRSPRPRRRSATSGPGAGVAGPLGSFASYPDVSKLTLAALMWLGRLEIIPVMLLLTRHYWRGR